MKSNTLPAEATLLKGHGTQIGCGTLLQTGLEVVDDCCQDGGERHRLGALGQAQREELTPALLDHCYVGLRTERREGESGALLWIHPKFKIQQNQRVGFGTLGSWGH